MPSYIYVPAGTVPNDAGNAAPTETQFYVAGGLFPPELTVTPTADEDKARLNGSHVGIRYGTAINIG